MKWELNKKKLTGEYIAGIVQADGSFSVILARKSRNSKQYLYLSLSFTIVQSQKYKDLILEIQKVFGGIGHWYLNKKDNTIRYQVTNQRDFLNVIIPFFMKYQLRSGKLLSFLYFKYIVEVMATKAHRMDKKVLLSLIVIASNMNPLGKLGNNIRYLTSEEQNYVINNVQPEGVDISKLTESIKNFKQNELTLDFIHGLFDGDGNITVYFMPTKSLSSVSPQVPVLRIMRGAGDQKVQWEAPCTVSFSFTIVQDRHNMSLLNEIKKYFNDKGGIHVLSKECNIYKVASKPDLMSVILPKMVNKESMESIKDSTIEELKLPLLKYNKIYYVYKILEYCPVGFRNSKEIMSKIIRWSYYVIKNSDDITLEEYVKEMSRKWFL